MTQRSRSWCLTVNNYTDDDIETLKGLESQYLIIGDELGENNTPHLQVYVYFKNAISFNSIKKKIGKAHIEAAMGSAKANRDYCSKQKVLYESGEIPNMGKRTDLEIMKELVLDGNSNKEIIRTNVKFTPFVKHMNLIREAHEEERNWETIVKIYWGKSGTGKSRKAFEEGCVAVEYHNGFFLKYNGEDNVLFDDYEGYEFPRSLLLKLTDRYPMTINIKGGERNWKPKLIIFTSNTNPKSWSCWDSAFERRINEVIQF